MKASRCILQKLPGRFLFIIFYPPLRKGIIHADKPLANTMPILKIALLQEFAEKLLINSFGIRVKTIRGQSFVQDALMAQTQEA